MIGLIILKEDVICEEITLFLEILHLKWLKLIMVRLSMQVIRGNKIMLSLGMFNVEIVQVGVGDDADTGLPEEDLEVDIQGYPKGVYFPKINL